MSIMKVLNKWTNLSAVTKSAVAFTISSILLKGISFITVPVLTRVLDSTQYGVVSIYNSWASIIEVFALLGLTSAGVFNVGLNDYRDNRKGYVWSALVICNIVTILCFLFIVLIKLLFSSAFILSTGLLCAMFVHFLFSPAMIMWVSWERYEYRYKAAIAITILHTFFSQLATVLIIILSGVRTAEVKVWGSVLSSLVFQLPIYVLIFRRGKNLFSTTVCKTVLAFSLPLLPHYLAQHVMVSADKIMITSFQSEEATAFYAVALNVGMVATVIWNGLNASLLPWVFEQINEKKYAKINNVTISLVLVYSSFCILLTLLAPEILKILAPNTYSSGVKAVPAVMGTAFMTALYNVYANVEFYHKKTKTIALATTVATILNLTMNACLIPRFGFEGAAYATMFSYVGLITIHYIGYRKCKETRIYRDKLIFAISVLSIICIEAIRVLYNIIVIRYLITALIMLIFISGICLLCKKKNKDALLTKKNNY